MSRTAFSTTALLLLPALACAQPANLNYDYVDMDFGIGKYETKILGRNIDVKSENVSLLLSKSLDANNYLTLEVYRARIDDSDQMGGIRFNLDATESNYTLAWGYALPLNESVDFTMGLGINKSDQDSTLTRHGAGSSFDSDEDTTSVAWSLGLRSYITQGLELAAAVSGVKDQTVFTLSGPIQLTENLGLNTVYSYTKSDIKNVDATNSVLSVGLRYSF